MFRYPIMFGLVLLLGGCSSERQFARDTLWPFGNPGAPAGDSETARRALGETALVTPIGPQAGDVWPGGVQPMPTLGDIQQTGDTPLGQGYMPALPSPYPPGDAR